MGSGLGLAISQNIVQMHGGELAYNPDAEYYDLNASSQCYCNHQFMELESLGEKTTILPGDSVDHREVWKVFQNVELFPGEPGAAQLASNLKLNEFATRYICNST